MNRFSSVLRGSIPVLLVLTSLAQATQIIYRSPEQMGEESALVVRGRVTGIRSYWNDNRSKIFTEAILSVDETFKGNAGRSVSVVQLGGTVGHVQMKVEGALAWSAGEEVLLFLESRSAGGYMVYGLSQGRYMIERDDRGRPFVSRSALEGIEMIGRTGSSGSADGVEPLGSFIERALGSGGKGGSS